MFQESQSDFEKLREFEIRDFVHAEYFGDNLRQNTLFIRINNQFLRNAQFLFRFKQHQKTFGFLIYLIIHLFIYQFVSHLQKLS